MAIHYFHCTDGTDLIVDRSGQDARTFDDIRRRAAEVAASIKRAVPTYREWAGWAVHVYDERGVLDVVSFQAPA